MFSWILIILILACAGIVCLVLIGKIPQLRVIDISSLPKERERQVKEQIIFSKLQRTSGAKLMRVARVGSVVMKKFSRYGRRAVQKLYRIEQYYQKLKRSSEEGLHAYSEETIRQRLEMAQDLIKHEEFIPAEKIFIDLISHNPKSVQGYEFLGNMYVASGQMDQARETFLFALRLSPEDASVNSSLAELELASGDPKKALVYLQKAVQKRPKNPRYLDFYIDVALQTGALKEARKGLQTLKEVNPENKKIQEFEERLDQKKAEYVNKTSSDSEEPSQEE
mgnify:CR=1 FL=1